MIAFQIKLSIKEIPFIEDQSKNGVKVIVSRFSGGTHVEASCNCFGAKNRVHSNPSCVNLKRL